MTVTRSHTLCCMPVRIGVFVIAILGLPVGVLFAAVGIIRARNTDAGKPILIVHVIVYISLALISIFGLMSVIMRRRRLVVLYGAMMIGHFIFSIVSGAFLLENVFKNAAQSWENCTGGATAEGTEITDAEASCKKGVTTVKAAMVSSLALIWLLHLYGCIVVDKYTKQLAEEEENAKFKEETEPPTW